MQGDPALQVLDVRERAEWDGGHIPGSVRRRTTTSRSVPEGLDPGPPDRRHLRLRRAQRRGRQPACPPRRTAGPARRRRRRRDLGGAGMAGRGNRPQSQSTPFHVPGSPHRRRRAIFHSVAEVDLNVVCKNCGSEVSPYITECPYCGERLRKRAPKLRQEGEGVELAPEPQRRRRLRRARKPRASRDRPLSWLSAERPYATIATGAGRRGVAPGRAGERPRPVRPGRGDRAARRRLVAADRGPVRVRERRLSVRRRRRHRDLRHQPRAPLRAAGRAGRLPGCRRGRHVPRERGGRLPPRDGRKRLRPRDCSAPG